LIISDLEFAFCILFSFFSFIFNLFFCFFFFFSILLLTFLKFVPIFVAYKTKFKLGGRL